MSQKPVNFSSNLETGHLEYSIFEYQFERGQTEC